MGRRTYTPTQEPRDGREYTADEVEFLRAIQAWKGRHGPFPRWTDVLRVLKALGYKKEEMREKG
jgi:hypothetical protein